MRWPFLGGDALRVAHARTGESSASLASPPLFSRHVAPDRVELASSSRREFLEA